MTQVAGYFGLAGFLWLACFQTLLAFGAPMGQMAWGGAQKVLSPARRWASAAVVPLASMGAVLVAERAGMLDLGLSPLSVSIGLGAFGLLFAVSFLGNALSTSRIERLHGVPLTLILSGCCAILAVS